MDSLTKNTGKQKSPKPCHVWVETDVKSDGLVGDKDVAYPTGRIAKRSGLG